MYLELDRFRVGENFLFKPKQMRRFIDDLTRQISLETSKMAIFIFLAWLKDTDKVDNDPETLIDEYKHLESWFNAIDDHIISIKQLKTIVEKDLGVEILMDKETEYRRNDIV